MAWRRGIATEAARPLVAHAFETLGLAEVVAEIDERNGGLMRVAEKLGMIRRGTVVHAGRVSSRYTLALAAAHSDVGSACR